MLRITLLACLAALAGLTSAVAREGTSNGVDALLTAARACPRTLPQVMERTYGEECGPLSAELLLDTDGRLVMRARVRVQMDDGVRFEAWVGPLHAGGWIPTKRVLTSEAERTEAEQLEKLLSTAPTIMRSALRASIRTEDRPGPGDVALAVRPVPSGEGMAVDLRVGDRDKVRGMRFDPASQTLHARDADPAPDPITLEPRTLPPLEVPKGRWFNVEGAPEATSWRGTPLLILITDPG